MSNLAPADGPPNRTPAPIPTMTVRVPDWSDRAAAAYSSPVREVTIPTVCAACGGPRGTDTIRTELLEEFGVDYFADRWENPCGHVDHYDRVVVEASALEVLRNGTRSPRVVFEEYGDVVALVVPASLVEWLCKAMMSAPSVPVVRPPAQPAG